MRLILADDAEHGLDVVLGQEVEQLRGRSGFGPSSKVSAATFPVPWARLTGVGTGLIAPPGTKSGGMVGPPPLPSVVMRMSSTR